MQTILIGGPGTWKRLSMVSAQAMVTGVDPTLEAVLPPDTENEDLDEEPRLALWQDAYRESRIFRAGDGISSGEGLVEDLVKNGEWVCYLFDEFGILLKKGAIEGSTIYQRLSSLFVERRTEVLVISTRNRKPIIADNVWLSYIGGVQPTVWDGLAGKMQGTGFFSRQTLAASDAHIKRCAFDAVPLGAPLRSQLTNLRAPKWVEQARNYIIDWSWALPRELKYERLDMITEKAAMILAGMCGSSEITLEFAEAAVVWGDQYQRPLRDIFSPTDVDTMAAACEQAMLRNLPKEGKVVWNWLYNKAHLARFGSGMATLVRDQAVANQQMAYKRPHVWRLQQ